MLSSDATFTGKFYYLSIPLSKIIIMLEKDRMYIIINHIKISLLLIFVQSNVNNINSNYNHEKL